VSYSALQPARTEHPPADLHAFYQRSRVAAAWHPERDLDWSSVGDIPEELSETAWHLASQSVATEQIGLLVAAELLATVDDYDARCNLSLQVADEAKHSDVFETFARTLGGTVGPPADFLGPLDDGLSERAGSVGLFFVHTFLECAALDEFWFLQQAFAGTVLGAIYARVARDEARHVAFGMLYLSALTARQPELIPADGIVEYARTAFRLGGIDESTVAGLASLSGYPPERIRSTLERRTARRLGYLTRTTGIDFTL
jgi:hypothetical protein